MVERKLFTLIFKYYWLVLVVLVDFCFVFQMAYQRRGPSSADGTEQDYTDDNKLKVQPTKDRTTLVIFIGLLLDLLGINYITTITSHYNTCSAFTLILPLFPSLIAHYRDQDTSGLFRLLENKVGIKDNEQLTAIYE